MSAGPLPVVSVCVPAQDAERWIADAVHSVLEQTMRELELIVVNDGSADRTAEVVVGFDDPRVRLINLPRNVGQARATNHAVKLARGELIKFLHADDTLDSDCLSTLAPLFAGRPRMTMAFAKRRVVVEDRADRNLLSWADAYREVHLPLGPLAEVNDGRELLGRWIEGRLVANWIGEPTSVMVRRQSLRYSGLFSTHIRNRIDVDLWLRLLWLGEVGFVDQELSTYRVRGGSISDAVCAVGGDWLDNLWSLETLSEEPRLWATWPSLAQLRKSLRSRLFPTLVRSAVRGDLRLWMVTDLLAYLRFLAERAAGRSRLRVPLP